MQLRNINRSKYPLIIIAYVWVLFIKIKDALVGSRALMFLASVLTILVSCACFFYRGLNVIWYPHSKLDRCFALLFSLCVIGFAATLKSLAFVSGKPNTISPLLKYTLEWLAILGGILAFAAGVPLISKPYMYDYTKYEWILALMVGSVFILGTRYGYINFHERNRSKRKKDAKAKLRKNG